MVNPLDLAKQLVAVAILAVSVAHGRPAEDIRNVSEAELRRLVLASPMPKYPPGARTAGLKGSGLFRIEFRESGEVTNVRVLKSTGHKSLDLAAVETFRRWHIRPHTGCEGFIIPVTFTF